MPEPGVVSPRSRGPGHCLSLAVIFRRGKASQHLGLPDSAEVRTAWETHQAKALPPDPRSLMLFGPPAGQKKEEQSKMPCPAVCPPVSALWSPSNGTLSSAPAVTIDHEDQNSGILEPAPVSKRDSNITNAPQNEGRSNPGYQFRSYLDSFLSG
jgi:hypothetical protein